MRVKADRGHVLRVDVEIIQEHERLDEPGERPMRMPARAVGNAASACFGSGLGERAVHLEASCATRTGIFTRAHVENLLGCRPAILLASAIRPYESEPK